MMNPLGAFLTLRPPHRGGPAGRLAFGAMTPRQWAEALFPPPRRGPAIPGPAARGERPR